ncbi:MAG: substrate-binding domain-containing protein, partial [Clostridia bacterium]|nr:substrate-binding domain-containing protein [Clostridia bacterium]
ISDLEKKGVKVPEDLYVVSFGDYILAQIGKPSITSISIDHEELGRQSVYTYSYLRKASDDVYITASVATKLSIGESTAMSKLEASCSDRSYDKEDITSDFFKHPEIQAVITFENMLTKCDKLDMQILIGIMDDMTYNQLSERLYVSENVISYRVKRLCKLASITSKGKLAQAANKLLSAEAIEKYIIKKLS